MCNHVYAKDRYKMPRSWSARCLYGGDGSPLATVGSPGRLEFVSATVPLDATGACIFHSLDADWKRANDFQGQLLRLLELQENDKDLEWYDFVEFVFVGTPSVSPNSQETSCVFRLTNRTLAKHVYFVGAHFLDDVLIRAVDFSDGVDFSYCAFKADVTIDQSRLHGADFSESNFRQQIHFSRIAFTSYALFDNARFTSPAGMSGYVVSFADSKFDDICTFTGADFSLGDEAVEFVRTVFDDVVDFSGTKFKCHLTFAHVTFAGKTEFVDTVFHETQSSARYRGCAVEFNAIDIAPHGVVTFKSSDRTKRMFNHDVQISFNHDPEGILRFENANFNNLTLASRERLQRLVKTGAVEIGPGCIRYRFQTGIRRLSISAGNASLVVELCQVFTHYFTVCHGSNLGFEIVERSDSDLHFFYFTDEDISESAFLERLAETEFRLWSLLSERQTGAAAAFQEPPDSAVPARRDAVVDTVDAISALLGMFFRVGIRVARGSWTSKDTRSLLEAIRFDGDESTDRRAVNLHGVITDRYTYGSLAHVRLEHNAALLPMDSDRLAVDIAIVTAIEVERIAVCRAFGLGDGERVSRDGTTCWRGDVLLDNGRIARVLVARQLDMGNVDAAILATRVIEQWKPKFIFLVGIAASADVRKVKLGDVVVAKSVWYYEHAKILENGMAPQPEMMRADPSVLKRLVGLRAWHAQVLADRPDGTTTKPQMHIGVIACGEKVIASEAVRNDIASGHRQIAAIEMEGYGFSRALWQSTTPIGYIVLRGICDDGTSAKDDRWHAYAAASAASFAKHLAAELT